MVKKNNIFSVNDDDLTMKLVESNLAVHMTTTHKPVKKSLKFVSVLNLKAHSEGFLKIILSKGPNPCKWLKYGRTIVQKFYMRSKAASCTRSERRGCWHS